MSDLKDAIALKAFQRVEKLRDRVAALRQQNVNGASPMERAEASYHLMVAESRLALAEATARSFVTS